MNSGRAIVRRITVNAGISPIYVTFAACRSKCMRTARVGHALHACVHCDYVHLGLCSFGGLVTDRGYGQKNGTYIFVGLENTNAMV
jgi:hypothetical protein